MSLSLVSLWPGFQVAPRTLGGTLSFSPAMGAEFLLFPVDRDESFRKFWVCSNLQVMTTPRNRLKDLRVLAGIFVSEPKWIRDQALFTGKWDGTRDF